MTAPAPRLLGRLEALLLLAFGVASFLFARGPRYTELMNPAFRWVTIGGAVLLTLLAIALLRAPRHAPGPSAFVCFLTLALLIVLGRPDQSIGGSLAAPPFEPAVAREGYDDLSLRNLFRTLSEEADDVPTGKVVVQGRLHAVGGHEGTLQQLLLQPVVACCLADALAYAVRLELPRGVVPPDGATWVYTYGNLEVLPAPVETPPFRVGAIAYTAVSRRYVLRAEEIVDHRTLLEDVTARIPVAQCAAFRDALEKTGLAETLRSDGPYTVFAPIDSAFLRGVRSLATEGTGAVAAPRLERYLEDFVVAGTYTRDALLEEDSVEALSGRRLTLRIENGRPFVEGARILFADQLGRNGVVHIVHPAWPPESD